MKTKQTLLVAMLAATGLTAQAQSNYYDDPMPGYTYRSPKGAYHKDTEFVVSAGLMRSVMRYGNASPWTIGLDYTPYESGDDMFSYTFMANYIKSGDYWSMNPLGAGAILLQLFCKNVIEDEPTAKTIFMIMGCESMGLNFALQENVEVGPYWNLLRLSKWKGHSTYVTGAVGARAAYYFGSEDRWSLRARASYSWGYGNADWYGEQIYNLFGDDGESHYEDYSKPHTPFRGWNLGISIGYRL